MMTMNFDYLHTAEAGWKLSAAQKQRMVSYSLHAAAPAPLWVRWLPHLAKPLIGVGVAVATVFVLLLVWPLIRQEPGRTEITTGAPGNSDVAQPDEYIENPEQPSGSEEPNTPQQDPEENPVVTPPADTEEPEDTPTEEPANTSTDQPEGDETTDPQEPEEEITDHAYRMYSYEDYIQYIDTWMDPSMTKVQKAAFFDIVFENRFNGIPQFDLTKSEPNKINWEDFIYYMQRRWTTVNQEGERELLGSDIKTVGKKLFDALTEDAQKELQKIEDTKNYYTKSDTGIKTLTMYSIPEPVGFKKETKNGRTIVTVRCILWQNWDYCGLEMLFEEAMSREDYPNVREGVINGIRENPEVFDNFGDFFFYEYSYYTEDGITPTSFISFKELSKGKKACALEKPIEIVWPE